MPMRLATLAGLILVAANAQAMDGNAVDRAFTATGDITGDGAQDQLVIHVSGRSMTSPFTWTLVIKDPQGHVLLDMKTDDSKSDAFFAQRGYEDNCSDYVSCKQQYYFKDIPKAVFDCLQPVQRRKLPDGSDDMSWKPFAVEFFAKHKVPTAIQRAAMAEMQRTLSQASLPILVVPMSPVQSGPPMVWVQAVRSFVPIFQQ
jgi:hypothetical protein